MKDIYLFDVDNTLTAPRQKILKEHKNILKKFIDQNNVYFISGSDLQKVKWQLGGALLKSAKGTFTCLGNAYYNNNIKKVYCNKFKELKNKKLLEDIQKFLNESKTPHKTGNHIEKRIGMLNISTIGRNCTIEQRKEYHKFDQQVKERDKFVEYLKNNYPELDVSVGGEISIDISVKNYNKSQLISVLNNEIQESVRYIFFGDRCDPKGNDYPLAKAIAENNSGKVYIIKEYNETYEILKSFLL